MSVPFPRRLVCQSLLLGALFTSTSVAQQPPSASTTPTTRSFRTSNRPQTLDLSSVVSGHPLTGVVEYARKERDYLRRTVHDFTCRLIKRERIDDFLQDYQYIDMWVREEVRDGSHVVAPLSIYMQFLAPRKIAGRRVLFIEGQNDGRMLVRNGGKHFDYVVVDVDPYGKTAMDESLVPVTQTGFNQILAQMIAVLERHMAADPTGSNTEVRQIDGAKLNKRPASVIRISHKVKQPGLEFHIANVFVDQELHVPVRVDYSDWPTREGQRPPLIAEYTYTLLKMNVGLTDANFSPRLLRSRAK